MSPNTASVSTTFDLLLRGGRVIDPAAGVDGVKDVAIRNGKIAAVQADILPSSAKSAASSSCPA
jgi:dihydroorotase